ncbi:choline transporter-like protein 4 isoform X2 [Convolutriloba macropyga]|uniref:choline transporter-like protein 4 isoform X2 n=1 Tax=Convolutriloba macropyga TaxID=536237 RepID=UPI003F522B42
MGNPKNNHEINRSCTDIICCLIFLIFLIGYGIIGFLAFYNGNPKLLLHPQDSEGNLCGVDNGDWGGPDMADKPNLFMFDISKCASFPSLTDTGRVQLCPTVKICVASCPSTYWTYVPDVATYESGDKASIDYNKYICQYDVDSPQDTLDGNPSSLVGRDKCASYYLDSFSLFGYCVPSILEDFTEEAQNLVINANGDLVIDGNSVKSDQNDSITLDSLTDGAEVLSSLMGATEKASSFFQDIYNYGWIIAVFLGIALVATLLCLFLLQFFVNIFVWTLLLSVLAASGLLSAFFWYEYKTRKDEAEASGAQPEQFKLTTNFAYYTDLYTTYLILAIIATVLFAILLFTVLFLFNRVRLAIQLIIEGSKCVLDNLSTVILPGVTWILILGVLSYAVATSVYIAAYGVQVQNQTTTDDCADNDTRTDCVKNTFVNCYVNVTDAGAVASGSNCFLMKYINQEYIKVMQLYNILGGLWLIFFVLGAIQVIQAGVYADWYWAQGDTRLLPTTRSVYRLFRYHTGSVAFGSFLIATLTLLRMFLEYIDEKLKSMDKSDVAKFMLKCMKCFMYCLEKAVKVINKNAYIVIACYGKNYCSSAAEALRILVTNCVRVVVLNTITEALLFICQLGIVIGMGFLSYFAITKEWLKDYYEAPELTYFFAPIIVVVLGTWVICKLFFDVYDMAIDTLFICVLEDLEHNNGSVEKPYHMSTNIQKLLVKGDAHNIGDSETKM